MARQLPQLSTYGVFTLLAPFTITPVNYTCVALQLITTLIDQNVDVFAAYYAPHNLTTVQYQQDIADNVAIVTLESMDGPTVLVPSSYIDTMPVERAVPYSRLFFSLDLGELPDGLPLAQLEADMAEIAHAYVGVTPVPRLHKVDIQTTYTVAEHKVKEAQRLANISNNVSFYAGKLEADRQLALARDQIRMLEQALLNANTQIQTLTHP